MLSIPPPPPPPPPSPYPPHLTATSLRNETQRAGAKKYRACIKPEKDEAASAAAAAATDDERDGSIGGADGEDLGLSGLWAVSRSARTRTAAWMGRVVALNADRAAAAPSPLSGAGGRGGAERETGRDGGGGGAGGGGGGGGARGKKRRGGGGASATEGVGRGTGGGEDEDEFTLLALAGESLECHNQMWAIPPPPGCVCRGGGYFRFACLTGAEKMLTTRLCTSASMPGQSL